MAVIKFNQSTTETESKEDKFFQPVENWLECVSVIVRKQGNFNLAQIDTRKFSPEEKEMLEKIRGILAEANYKIKTLTNGKIYLSNTQPRFFKIANADIWVAEDIEAIKKHKNTPTLVKREIRKGNYDEIPADELLVYTFDGVQYEITIADYVKSKPLAWQLFPYCVIQEDDLFD